MTHATPPAIPADEPAETWGERIDRHSGRIMVLPAVIVILCFAVFPLIISAYLALSRFALAPIFPLLISETPLRLGAGLSQHAIGFQVGAASLGIAVLPSLAGIIATRTSMEAIPIFLIAVVLALITLHEMQVRVHA